MRGRHQRAWTERIALVDSRRVQRMATRSRSQLVRYFVPSKLVLVDNPLEAVEVPAWD